MNISTLLRQASEKIDRLDAEVLLAHLLGKDRSYFRAWPEKQLDSTLIESFNEFVSRRQQGEPLAYIVGWREFWSMRLSVTPATLIPRPDTELLVEQALNLIPRDADWCVADLGTGSGAIALAIASERPGCAVVATDVSVDALSVAQANAVQLGVKNIEFRHASWADAFADGERFQLIASNPPYVDGDDDHLLRDGLPYEPQGALTPGKDGLADIRLISEQAKHFLCAPGWLLLEHGYDQAAQVREILSTHGYDQIVTHQDLGRNDRITIGRISSPSL